ncbi:HOG (high osmolarity glycerol) pathway protein [Vermiconidia calcicola]|uniref:HOG (High osmolarity glycerol) pathway protein n=1 Tax=Vermiconidia calcicola TaxID=1690605 RepID=A0ACC3P138_9PEZI|nr:HOG (high osmolarity glycerol) pathway protein [Vermiconidia calcicola]
MAEVLPPPATTSSRSPHDSSDSFSLISQPQPQPRERVASYAQSRMSQYSRSSQRLRPQSVAPKHPAFNSSLPYALVRDFAYPVFHPLHYGAELEPSGGSTPGSEWGTGRRQSDPMDQWNGGTTTNSGGGWTAGPWGGDGVMYDEAQHDSNITALPRTSFGGEEGVESGEDDLYFKKGKHRKSKSYANISDFERGRRRESGRRSKETTDPSMFYFHGQQNDPAGRDSLRQSRGYSNSGIENGPRRDSRFAATLPNRSFHHSHSANTEELDPDEHIPLDTEPHPHHSPVRDSMGPEDEELFAGPSLALYSFEPENSNELRLVEGQEIMVSYRHGQGWLVASDPKSGEQGLVPEAYVRLIAEMPNYDPETGEFVDIEEIEESDAMEDGDHTGDGEEKSAEPVLTKSEDDEDSEEDSDSPSPVELTSKKLEGAAES